MPSRTLLSNDQDPALLVFDFFIFMVVKRGKQAVHNGQPTPGKIDLSGITLSDKKLAILRCNWKKIINLLSGTFRTSSLKVSHNKEQLKKAIWDI